MKTYIFICREREKKNILCDEQVVGEHSLQFCIDFSHNMHVVVTGYLPVTITSPTFSYRLTSNPVCMQLLESLRYVVVDPFNSYVGVLLYYVWAIFSNIKFYIPVLN